MRALLILLALAGYACSDSKPEQESRIAELATAVDSFDRELDDAEAQVRALSSDFSEIVEAYDGVSARYRAARQHYASANTSSDQAASVLRQAVREQFP